MGIDESGFVKNRCQMSCIIKLSRSRKYTRSGNKKWYVFRIGVYNFQKIYAKTPISALILHIIGMID